MAAERLFSRAIIRLSPQAEGEDVADFLQGLVTQDVTGELPAWAGLLTPQGKTLFDFIVWPAGHGELLINRAQMAVMLIKGLYGKTYVPPAATGTVFTDVPKTLPLAAWIEQLARMQVTLGCTATTYCPNGTITRAEMAVFFSRQFSLPAGP